MRSCSACVAASTGSSANGQTPVNSPPHPIASHAIPSHKYANESVGRGTLLCQVNVMSRNGDRMSGRGMVDISVQQSLSDKQGENPEVDGRRRLKAGDGYRIMPTKVASVRYGKKSRPLRIVCLGVAAGWLFSVVSFVPTCTIEVPNLTRQACDTYTMRTYIGDLRSGLLKKPRISCQWGRLFAAFGLVNKLLCSSIRRDNWNPGAAWGLSPHVASYNIEAPGRV